MNPLLIGCLWCALAAVASASATLLIKLAGDGSGGWTLVRLGYLGGACATYGVGFVCYALALQKMQISLAYPVMTAITLTLVTLLGYLVLQEALTPVKLTGLALIAAGAFALSR
jgi:quaternary ammonium compound-resistance protein SugE